MYVCSFALTAVSEELVYLLEERLELQEQVGCCTSTPNNGLIKRY